jgi:hypothetical protein
VRRPASSHAERPPAGFPIVTFAGESLTSPTRQISMSFHNSSALESQPTTWRREDDPQYADDPEYREFAQQLSDKLFSLTRNVTRLSDQIAILGTKRETARVRERVHEIIDDTSTSLKEIGEGLKKLTTWPDVGVCIRRTLLVLYCLC